MRAPRTQMGDCNVKLGEHYLFIRDGIIIDNSGDHVIRLLAQLCGHGREDADPSRLAEFLKLLAAQKVDAESVFVQAAYEIRALPQISVGGICVTSSMGNMSMGNIDSLYRVRLRTSNGMRKKIYEMMQEKICRKTYYEAFGMCATYLNTMIARELERCRTAELFKKIMAGYNERVREFYISENVEKWIAIEGRVTRKLHRMERAK